MTPPFALPGPSGGLPAGFARVLVGARVLRRHRPGQTPDWFGPPIGTLGENRFDPPHPRRPVDPGVCYLAEQLGGVIHEGVLRGSRHRALSRRTLSAHHAVSEAVLSRDLVVIDLVHEPGVHGIELADLAQRPDLGAKLMAPKGLVYRHTQALAGTWLARNASATFPVSGGTVDGILYVSRFAPAQRCLALWQGAADALEWTATTLLGDHAALDSTLAAIGVGLLD